MHERVTLSQLLKQVMQLKIAEAEEGYFRRKETKIDILARFTIIYLPSI